jgi:hypothetical protein
MISKIEKMLEDERKIIARTAKEVTIDFPAVRAELRTELLEELLIHCERNRSQ